MAPHRVVDFLKWAENYHQRLAEFYREREEEVAEAEVKALLAFMAEHQEALRAIIADYEHGASRAILETWYKNSPDLDSFEDPGTAEFPPDMTLDDAIEQALKLDRSLVSMYEMLLRSAPIEGLSDMLESLLEKERTAEIQVMRARLAE